MSNPLHGAGAWRVSALAVCLVGAGCGSLDAFNTGRFDGEVQLQDPGADPTGTAGTDTEDPGGNGNGNGNGGTEACPDEDDDGVCDEDDLCPGEDDEDDDDNDGVPAGCDPCPVDPDDDSDGDSVCDSDDACPGADDGVDPDGDGNPTACDDCPEDAADDPDGDGICEGEDPCPGDGTNTCPWTVNLNLQCDDWPGEASWIFRYESGVEIAEGTFATDWQITNRDYDVPYGSAVCLTVKDTFGDGGIGGTVTIVDTGAVVGTWLETDYLFSLAACFTVQ